MPANPVPIQFPLGGINENGPFAQPPGPIAVSQAHVLNVRPYDAIQRRLRGGQRTGIEKYFAEAICDDSPIQTISSFVEAFDPTNIVIDEIIDDDGSGHTDTFSGQPSNVPIQTHNAQWDNFEGSGYFDAPATGANGMQVWQSSGAAATSVGPTQRAGAAYDAGAALGTAYFVKFDFQADVSTDYNTLGLVWRLSADPTDRDYFLLRINNNAVIQFLIVTGGSFSSQETINVPAMATGVAHTLAVQVNGDQMKFFLDTAQIGSTATSSTHAGNGRFGFLSEIDTAPPNQNHALNFTAATGVVPASLRTTNIVAICEGNFFVGTPTEGLVIPTGGTSAVRAAGRVAVQEAFQDVFLADGITANYNFYDANTNQVLDWEAALTAGTLPAGTVDPTVACRIMTLYRGRVVLSGLQEEPQNWFMAESGDPFNWDFAPVITSAIQAVAGNLSDLGELGDIVTALIPFQDDLLFMGGDHTLWVMRGDPASGGNIDNVSRQIGIVGPDAWTWDTGSTLYFFGQNGLYRMAPGSGEPQLLSSGKMDRIFSDIDTATNSVRLLYDREWQGVHIYITPQSEPSVSPDHYWWDQRTDSFWRDNYPTNIGPTAVHLFDADDPGDRAVLLGGFDGFIRNYTDVAANDDGVAINSFARFPILHPSLTMGQFQMNDLQMHTDNASDDVEFDIFRGTTPEEAAVSATSIFNATFVGGRNLPVRTRQRANSLEFRLQNDQLDETWAYENGTVLIKGVGRQRALLP